MSKADKQRQVKSELNVFKQMLENCHCKFALTRNPQGRPALAKRQIEGQSGSQ